MSHNKLHCVFVTYACRQSTGTMLANILADLSELFAPASAIQVTLLQLKLRNVHHWRNLPYRRNSYN